MTLLKVNTKEENKLFLLAVKSATINAKAMLIGYGNCTWLRPSKAKEALEKGMELTAIPHEQNQ